MKQDPRYAPRYESDDSDRDPGWDASRGEPYRSGRPQYGGSGQERARAERADDGHREPWRDPAPSFGYQGEGTRAPGGRTTRAGVRSRSADPGQSSYGGFSNEDPSYQRQQVYGSRRIDPRGYIRSDERVREIVCEHLAHSGLDVSDVSVNVAEGCVTLEGTVPDRRTKHRVEDSVDACAGVKDVDNRIRIAGSSAARETGAAS
ncbi:BON domain-containing protein [Achromobacter xylosoxidans]|nr:BON domain-containing protein [Achromobacter xylosoxidans]